MFSLEATSDLALRFPSSLSDPQLLRIICSDFSVVNIVHVEEQRHRSPQMASNAHSSPPALDIGFGRFLRP